MDWTIIITSLVSAICAGGGIAGLINWRENKRAKKIENESNVSDMYKELLEAERSDKQRITERSCKKSEKIDNLYQRIYTLNEELNKKDILIAELQLTKCTKVKCADRTPPFGTNHNLA